MEMRGATGHAIVASNDYRPGCRVAKLPSSVPRYLGLQVVLAQSFARIHWQNLVNFGVLPLTFNDPADYDTLVPGNVSSFLVFAERCSAARRS